MAGPKPVTPLQLPGPTPPLAPLRDWELVVPTIAQKVARVGQHRGRDGEIRHGVQSGAGFKDMGNHVHRKRDGRYAAWYFRASG